MNRPEYATYINSPAWRAKRAQWWKLSPSTDCAVCGGKRRPGMHLHHRSYRRLGNERIKDLVALCPPCHQLAHEVRRLRGSPLWGIHVYARRYLLSKAWPPRRGRQRKTPIAPPSDLAIRLRKQILAQRRAEGVA